MPSQQAVAMQGPVPYPARSTAPQIKMCKEGKRGFSPRRNSKRDAAESEIDRPLSFRRLAQRGWRNLLSPTSPLNVRTCHPERSGRERSERPRSRRIPTTHPRPATTGNSLVNSFDFPVVPVVKGFRSRASLAPPVVKSTYGEFNPGLRHEAPALRRHC